MPQLIYNPYLEITSLIFLGLILFHFFKNNTVWNLQNRVYIGFVIITTIGIVFDVITAVTITYAASIPLWVNVLVNTIYYLTQLFVVAFFLLFNMVLTKTIYGDKRKLFFFFSPFLIFIVLLFINSFTDIVFYFDSSYNLIHGIGFYLLFLSILYSILCTLVIIIKYKKNLTHMQFSVLVFFISLFIVSTVIQNAYQELLLSGVSVTAGLMAIYLTFQSPITYIDKSTGIYGREAFIIITDEIYACNDTEKQIITVDICNLKKINGFLGVYGGDNIIIQISNFLSSIAPQKASLFRLSGSTFALIVKRKHFREYEDKIVNRFNKMWKVFNVEIEAKMNISFIAPTEVATSSEELLAIIENVLIMANSQKQKGKRLIVDRAVIEKIRRKNIIEKALSTENISDIINVYYQPIYSIKKKCFTSAEALSRMFIPKLGKVSTDEFIPVAEQTGLITKIGEHILNEVCRFAQDEKLWEKGINEIDINISVIECLQPGIGEKIQTIINKYPEIIKNNFKINYELTETSASAATDAVRNLIKKLSGKNFSFSLDDYGQGYSNSDTVIDMPFRTIKIDKNMLYACENETKARMIYAGMARTFCEMNLSIIAEGVETEEQFEFIKSSGIDLIQGYYFSKPLPKELFIKKITNQEGVFCTYQQN
ncbi:MAG: hypothetical protein DBX47_07580 [Clostridiales bacterium]|nr:MAG: hypothetical protein DBX47_07580 [Clostridiales bacterium]